MNGNQSRKVYWYRVIPLEIFIVAACDRFQFAVKNETDAQQAPLHVTLMKLNQKPHEIQKLARR